MASDLRPLGEAGSSGGYGTRLYRAFVLAALTLIYAINYVDRSLVSLLQEPIKKEFSLSDLQLGLLGGPAFALLYGLMAIPIARLSERHVRTTILSICLAIWSLMTAICGLAASYTQIFLARMGVSVGEAGCTPIAQSMISDYFPKDRRSTALAIYASGSSLGAAAGAALCGLIAEAFGWRAVFLALGVPGIVLAVIARALIKEPPRPALQEDVSATALDTLSALWSKPTFRHVMIGSMVGWLVALGMSQYGTSFLMRTHGLSLANATAFTGGVISLSSAFGIFLGGFLSDRLQHNNPRSILVVPALGLFIAAPCACAAYLAPNLWIAGPLLSLAWITLNLFSAPMYALAMQMVQPKQRAMAIAIVLLIIALFGNGLGPPLVGWISDHIAGRFLEAQGFSSAVCEVAQGAVATACAQARGEGLRYALALITTAFVWGGLHFLRARRTYLSDRVD